MKASDLIPEVPSNTALMPELLHLRADAHADRRQAAEIDDVGLEFLRLGQFGGEVLLVRGDAEGAEDLPAVLLQRTSLKYWLWPLP